LPAKVNNPKALPPGVGLAGKWTGADSGSMLPSVVETTEEGRHLVADVQRALRLAGGSMKLCELGQAFSAKTTSLFKPSALSWFKERRALFMLEDLGNGDFRVYLGKPAEPPQTAETTSGADGASGRVAVNEADGTSPSVVMAPDVFQPEALRNARALVSQGKGETMMPEGTWGMRVPLSATRLCALALRMAPQQRAALQAQAEASDIDMKENQSGGRPTAALKQWLDSGPDAGLAPGFSRGPRYQNSHYPYR
jgi:hypothetical protein